MEFRFSALTAFAAVVLVGCQTPDTGVKPTSTKPPELTIQGPAQTVRAATIRTMTDRGYKLTPFGTDTLLFDRTADLGSTLRIAFFDGREAWRRVRIRLLPADLATRVTAEPFLVINRGELHEHEEPDDSESARQTLQEILEKIQTDAGR